MNQVVKSIKLVLVGFLMVAVLGISSFYLLVGLGASPKLQTVWVTTAMTTMNHKWLATYFVPQKTIDRIMEENYVDDTGFDSDILDKDGFIHKPNDDQIDNDETNNIEQDIVEKDIYVKDGYTKKEEGLYIKQISGTGWKGYAMLVSNPKRVKLVDTPKQYETGQTVMKMITAEGAIAGINGGGFQDGPNYDSNGGTPAGLVIENGKLVAPKVDTGARYNMIGINKDGVLILRHSTATWALENDIVSAVSFNPFLVVNGEGTIKSGTGGWGIAPRTGIGQRKTGEIIFIVIDGRQPTWSVGVDINVVQDALLAEKCENGALLDGGSSTVMIYDKKFVNRPSLGFERYINNAWVVMPIEDSNQ